jgi:hypothetical protein
MIRSEERLVFRSVKQRLAAKTSRDRRPSADEVLTHAARKTDDDRPRRNRPHPRKPKRKEMQFWFTEKAVFSCQRKLFTFGYGSQAAGVISIYLLQNQRQFIRYLEPHRSQGPPLMPGRG